MVLAILNIERGRDSFGFTTEAGTIKGLGSIVPAMRSEDFPISAYSAQMFLGHTRNSSVGGVSLKNAHPFEIGRITGAHNGRVNNFWELKREYAVNDKTVESFDVDSQIIFYMLDKFGVKSLSRIEGKVACWWIDKDIPEKVFFWVWNQDFSVADAPHMAFSSDGDHLRIAGFSKIRKLDDGGQVVFINNTKLSQGFRQQEEVPGKTYTFVQPAKTAWVGDDVQFYPPRVSTSKSINAEEMSRIGKVWNQSLNRYVKESVYLAVVSDKGVTDQDQIHRILLSSIHIGIPVFQCMSCNQLVTKRSVSENVSKQVIHVGCGGVCHEPAETMKREMKFAASTAISLFVGKVEPLFAPRQIRAFVKNDRTMLAEFDELMKKRAEIVPVASEGKQLHLPVGAKLTSLCTVCLGCISNKEKKLPVISCDAFRHVDNVSCCKLCEAKCDYKTKGANISRCMTFTIVKEDDKKEEVKPDYIKINDSPIGGVCTDCLVNNCTVRGKVIACHDRIADNNKDMV